MERLKTESVKIEITVLNEYRKLATKQGKMLSVLMSNVLRRALPATQKESQ